MMTRAQKRAILERRADGITYQAIADETGLSLGSVKMFVSRYTRKFGTPDSVGEADSDGNADFVFRGEDRITIKK